MPTLTSLSPIEWDKSGEKLYETGVDHCVLYPYNTVANPAYYGPGVAWNGITNVSENPSGAEANPFYADNIKYANLLSAEEFGASIGAYMYPDEWKECDGSKEIAPGVFAGQQTRKTFGLSYRTVLGNDTQNNNYGYKLHLIYGATASPSEQTYNTINDSPELIEFSWELNTTPVNVSGAKPTACLVIDSTKVTAGKLKNLEEILYGITANEYDATATYNTGDYAIHTNKLYRCKADKTTGTWSSSAWDEIDPPSPRLPLPDEVASILAAS